MIALFCATKAMSGARGHKATLMDTNNNSNSNFLGSQRTGEQLADMNSNLLDQPASQHTGAQLADMSSNLLDQPRAGVAVSAWQFAAGTNEYLASEQLIGQSLSQIIQNILNPPGRRL